MRVITEDSILMHAKDLGLNTQHYAHRLDASKNPKQINITITRGKGETVGVIKGIYVLEGDELRLCLGEMGKDRPAAFPEKRKPGEVLVLRRAGSGATPPTAKDAKTGRKVLTPEEAIQQRPTEKVTVKFKVNAVLTMRVSKSNVVGDTRGGFDEVLILKYDDSLVVQLLPPAMDTLRRLGIAPDKHFKGKMVQVTGRLGPGPFVNLLPPGLYPDQFQIVGADLSQIEIVGE